VDGTGDHRVQALAGIALAHQGEGPVRPAVERPMEGEDLALPRLEAGHLDGDLHRLRARVAELHLPGDVAGRELNDAPGERGVDRVDRPHDVEKLARLVADRRDDPRMAVPGDGRPEAGHEVEVAVAVGIDDPRALTPVLNDGLGTEGERRVSRGLVGPGHLEEGPAVGPRVRRDQLRRLHQDPP